MPNEKRYDESTLLAQLVQDSQYAFELIFDHYRDRIYKVALLYVKSPLIAEEIVQDVFLKLWLHRHHLSEIQSLEAWLFVITRNHTLNAFDKIVREWKVRRKWLHETRPVSNAADVKLIETEYQNLLREAVNSLSPQQQHVYRLAREQGLSHYDIGSLMSISPLTVKTHMQRALNSIRSFLQQKGIAPFFILLATCL